MLISLVCMFVYTNFKLLRGSNLKSVLSTFECSENHFQGEACGLATMIGICQAPMSLLAGRGESKFNPSSPSPSSTLSSLHWELAVAAAQAMMRGGRVTFIPLSPISQAYCQSPLLAPSPIGWKLAVALEADHVREMSELTNLPPPLHALLAISSPLSLELSVAKAMEASTTYAGWTWCLCVPEARSNQHVRYTWPQEDTWGLGLANTGRPGLHIFHC